MGCNCAMSILSPPISSASSTCKCTTSPMTTLAAPGWSPSSTICVSRHSKWMGLSATRGGRTTLDGAGVNPAAANSFTSAGSSVDVMFIAGPRASVTMLITNSPVARTLCNVSLGWPSVDRIIGQNRTCGGLAPAAVKNENGARFGSPASFTVDTQPMARGTIDPIISLYSDCQGREEGVISKGNAPLRRGKGRKEGKGGKPE